MKEEGEEGERGGFLVERQFLGRLEAPALHRHIPALCHQTSILGPSLSEETQKQKTRKQVKEVFPLKLCVCVCFLGLKKERKYSTTFSHVSWKALLCLNCIKFILILYQYK